MYIRSYLYRQSSYVDHLHRAIASAIGWLALAAGSAFYAAEKEIPSAESTPSGMVWVAGGEFTMGSDAEAKSELCTVFGPKTDAGPEHRVRVDGFWLDATEVTNEQFAAFVAATDYITVAERPLSPQDFPGVPVDALVPGSIVFTPPDHAVALSDPRAWWRYQPGACWRHPEGPGSDWHGREKYPVVHVAYADAVAFAHWAGKRLPTEAEWERAARGGREGNSYTWGTELKPGGKWQANIWQGAFPFHNSVEDGFDGTAPVRQFPANPYGLYDMAGNVWEWCSDWYRSDYYATLAKNSAVSVNPPGPTDSLDPAEPAVPKRVTRGGSYLCTDQYCTSYTVASRGRGDPGSGASNVGFRCARSVDAPTSQSRSPSSHSEADKSP